MTQNEGDYASKSGWPTFDSTGGGNDEWVRLKPAEGAHAAGEEHTLDQDLDAFEAVAHAAADHSDEHERPLDPSAARTVREWLKALPPHHRRRVQQHLDRLSAEFRAEAFDRAKAHLLECERDWIGVVLPGRKQRCVPEDYLGFRAFYDGGRGPIPPSADVPHEERRRRSMLLLRDLGFR